MTQTFYFDRSTINTTPISPLITVGRGITFLTMTVPLTVTYTSVGAARGTGGKSHSTDGGTAVVDAHLERMDKK